MLDKKLKLANKRVENNNLLKSSSFTQKKDFKLLDLGNIKKEETRIANLSFTSSDDDIEILNVKKNNYKLNEEKKFLSELGLDVSSDEENVSHESSTPFKLDNKDENIRLINADQLEQIFFLETSFDQLYNKLEEEVKDVLNMVIDRVCSN